MQFSSILKQISEFRTCTDGIHILIHYNACITNARPRLEKNLLDRTFRKTRELFFPLFLSTRAYVERPPCARMFEFLQKQFSPDVRASRMSSCVARRPSPREKERKIQRAMITRRRRGLAEAVHHVAMYPPPGPREPCESFRICVATLHDTAVVGGSRFFCARERTFRECVHMRAQNDCVNIDFGALSLFLDLRIASAIALL